MLCAAKRENSASSFVEIICETEIAGLVYGVLFKIICGREKTIQHNGTRRCDWPVMLLNRRSITNTAKISSILQPRYICCVQQISAAIATLHVYSVKNSREYCRKQKFYTEERTVASWGLFNCCLSSFVREFSFTPHLKLLHSIDRPVLISRRELLITSSFRYHRELVNFPLTFSDSCLA